MGHKWKYLKLKEAGVQLIDCIHKTPPAAENGYPYIGIPQMRSGGIDFSANPRLISKKHLDEWSVKAKPIQNDIILSRRCNPGETVYVPEGVEFALGQNLVILRASGELIYPPFLRWLVRGQEWWGEIGKYLNVGAVFDSLRCGDIPNFKLPIPPLSEQKRIAHILGSLDDKIELNRQMNATLEGMAQALFKSWFVDFDPVIDNALAAGNPIPEAFAARAETRRNALADGTANRDVAKQFPAAFQFTEEMGWIPEGWEVKKAESIVTRKKVNQKFTKKNVLTTGQIPVFDQGAGLLLGYHNGLPDIKSSQKNPSFIFGDHTCITHLSTKPFSVGPNVIPLEAKNYNSYWTYFAIKDIQNFQEYRRHWMEFKIKNVLVPLKNLASFFGNFIQNLYISIESKTDESSVLTNLRDTLLPKLISGEIRIPEAEKLTEEALA